MEEKDRPAADIDAREDDDATAPGGRVYDLDTDSAHPVEEQDDDAAAPDAPAPDEPSQGGRFKISKKQILDRFAEKNSAITKLQKEKTAAEKERDSLTAEKAALEGQVKEFKDKWLRSAAEFENYRKRTAKEWELLKQQSRTEVILEILNSLDDFERAFAVVEPGDESDFVKGIRLIHGNLVRVLLKLGVAEVDALHQPFDPTRHMAIGQIETTDTPSGNVAQVITKGYIFNGTVIRPAHVIVAK
ncbi:MAG TPA: nucleotide exchange factor GrpE [Candidatus Krumholzibacteria bacterium]